MINLYILYCRSDKINKILKALQKYNSNVDIQITVINKPDFSLEYFIRHKDADIVIIDADISVKNVPVNGMQIGTRIKLINRNTLLVFIADKDKLNTLVSIAKSDPFFYTTASRIEKDISAIFDKYSVLKYQNRNIFSYSKRGVSHDINLNEILYFVSDHRIIQFKNLNGDTDSFYDKLDNVEETIYEKTKLFIRVGQSYLVNLKYIINVVKNDIYMTDGTIIPISRRYGKILDFSDDKRTGE